MIWHSSDAADVLKELNTDREHGLTNAQVLERLEIYDKNSISSHERPSLLKRFFAQLKNKVVYFLVIISVISFVVGTIYEKNDAYYSLLIIAIVLINAFISTFHLHRSDQALDAIQNASNPLVNVIREGATRQVPSDQLVPGDIIILSEGDYITADARLIEADALRCNEAVLSGEIIPVEKNVNANIEDIAPVTARKNMVFSGTSVIHGTAKAVVVETGIRSEIGKIVDIDRQSNAQTLPITDTLLNSGKIINTVIFVLCIFTFIIGMLQNFNSSEPFASITVNSLMNAVALGICAMPESLPAISTIVIALGIQRMIEDNAVIKNTKALELIGKTEVICVDKTGIITKNNMQLACIYDGDSIADLNDAVISEKTASALQLATACSMLENDATETAIENACVKYCNMTVNDVGNLFPRLSAIPFDSIRKTMTSINMINGQPVAIVKGAPEILLSKCKLVNPEAVFDSFNTLAENSYRILCIAIKKLDEIPTSPNPDEIERDLKFVGLLGLYDPPQSDTVEAIKACDIAGIQTVMITGDNLITAKAIARRIGVLTDDAQAITGDELDKMSDDELFKNIEKYTVYARTTPDDKLRIISAWQSKGKIVAVTGNGSEDADALTAADIGCAVGQYGTDIAKGNADIIINNKKFMSLVNAIKESRGLFENVKKAVTYLLSCNFGEILTYIVGMIIFGVTPLVAVQLLWINLLTDCTSVISLTVEKAEFNVMRKKPLALSGRIFNANALINIACDSVFIAVITLLSYTVGNSINHTTAATLAFLTLSIIQILHSFNLKSQESLFKTDFKSNKFMNFTSILIVFITVFLIATPAGSVFGLVKLSPKYILYGSLMAISILPYSEIKKIISKRISK